MCHRAIGDYLCWPKRWRINRIVPYEVENSSTTSPPRDDKRVQSVDPLHRRIGCFHIDLAPSRNDGRHVRRLHRRS